MSQGKILIKTSFMLLLEELGLVKSEIKPDELVNVADDC